MFADRGDAGHRLGKRLLRYKEHGPLVLGLPRGGVAVAAAVAAVLDAPLDTVLVRKIVGPAPTGALVGTIVDFGEPHVVLDDEAIASLDISTNYVVQETARQLAEIERLRHVYVGDRAAPQIAGRTVLIVDDMIATGATMRAALQGVRQCRPARVVMAAAIGESDVVDALRGEADAVLCLVERPMIGLPEGWFRDARHLHDDQVTALLLAAAAAAKNRQRGLGR